MYERPRRVALLIDYDNLQICATRDTPGRDLQLAPVVHLAQKYGTVMVARAYAEWNLSTERLAVYKVGIEPAFAPVLRTESDRSGKSLADTVMVAEGMDILYTLTPDVLVLATSDKDLIPLVRVAKQRGAHVVVVGSDLTAIPLREMADEHVTYKQLINEAAARSQEFTPGRLAPTPAEPVRRAAARERDRDRPRDQAGRGEGRAAEAARPAPAAAPEKEKPAGAASPAPRTATPAIPPLPAAPAVLPVGAAGDSEGPLGRRRRRSRRRRDRGPGGELLNGVGGEGESNDADDEMMAGHEEVENIGAASLAADAPMPLPPPPAAQDLPPDGPDTADADDAEAEGTASGDAFAPPVENGLVPPPAPAEAEGATGVAAKRTRTRRVGTSRRKPASP